MNNEKKERGVLLHISSLYGRGGIGTLGRSAYEFVDWLESAGLTLWQVLPLCPTSYGDSPYQSPSAFAGNPYFIDLDFLLRDGLLTEEELAEADEPTGTAAEELPQYGKVDYAWLYGVRYTVLKKAFARFLERIPDGYRRFTQENADWLNDYALYMSLKSVHGMRAWSEWEGDARDSALSRLAAYEKGETEEEAFWKFLQYTFFEQWAALKAYAGAKGIRLIGDMPIYVAYDSVDVWGAPQLFQLKADFTPVRVAGVPPDAFSNDGQLWGNPLYDWKAMAAEGYDWWIRRIRMAMRMFDIVRIDHFRGFESFWSVRYGAKTAVQGRWRKGPGFKLFRAIRAAVPDAHIIAEDLGMLDDKVRRLMQKTGYPGMKVFQFGFGSDENDGYLPQNYPENAIAYTGTHDNDTTCGWFSALPPETQTRVRTLLHYDGNDLTGEMLRLLFTSRARYAVAPMQDFLRLGSEARMNVPATSAGNWQWRLTAAPDAALATAVRALSKREEVAGV